MVSCCRSVSSSERGVCCPRWVKPLSVLTGAAVSAALGLCGSVHFLNRLTQQHSRQASLFMAVGAVPLTLTVTLTAAWWGAVATRYIANQVFNK